MWCYRQMRLFLAGTCAFPWLNNIKNSLYILESYFYIQDWQIALIPYWKDFILDSGAFTFMSGNAAGVDLVDFTYKYAEFVNKHNIKYFLEMDIDAVAPYSKVEYLRNIIEQETGRKCIPAWHRSRGKQNFIDMCKEYDYVAIGGIVSGEIKKSEFSSLRWYTAEARKLGARVHGLGFTGRNFTEYGFFSVDSTSWLSGSKHGNITQFDGVCMKHVRRPAGFKTTHYKTVNNYVYDNWLLYQKYLDDKGE